MEDINYAINTVLDRIDSIKIDLDYDDLKTSHLIII